METKEAEWYECWDCELKTPCIFCVFESFAIPTECPYDTDNSPLWRLLEGDPMKYIKAKNIEPPPGYLRQPASGQSQTEDQDKG